MQKYCCKALAFLALGLFGQAAFAAAVQIVPVHIYLSKKQPVRTVTIFNKDKHAIILEAQVKRWLQRNGKDVYQAANNLIVTPPVVTVPAKSKAMIRIGSLTPINTKKEQAYRLVLQQIPEQAHHKIRGLRILVKFLVPVFIEPKNINGQSSEWLAKRIKKNEIEIIAKNTAPTHLQIVGLDLYNSQTNKLIAKKSTFTYILPSQQHDWFIKTPHDLSPSTHHLLVTALTNWGKVTEKVDI